MIKLAGQTELSRAMMGNGRSDQVWWFCLRMQAERASAVECSVRTTTTGLSLVWPSSGQARSSKLRNSTSEWDSATASSAWTASGATPRECAATVHILYMPANWTYAAPTSS